MLVIIGGMMSLGQALPNVEQVSVAGGSAMNLFETILKVRTPQLLDESED